MVARGLFCLPARTAGCASQKSGSQGSGLVPMGQKDAVSLEEPVPWLLFGKLEV